MKIIHLGSIPLSPDHPERDRVTIHPGRWVLNHAKAQREHTDLRSELVVQAFGATKNFSTEVEGVPVHYLAAPTRARALTCFQFDVRRIQKILRTLKPDLVHAHGTEDAYGLAAAQGKYPFVLTLQGVRFLINRVVPAGAISRARLVYLLEKFSLKRTRHVIAKSAYIAEAAKTEHPHLTVHRIPNTFDPAILDVPNVEREPRLVFVGTIIPRKGVDLLRKASKTVRDACPDARLDIVGNRGTPSEYETSELDALKSAWGDRLSLHGLLPPADLFDLLARSRLLVAPSLEEMFGNQLIEALLLGTHAVVSDGTAMAENVRAFGNGSIFANGDHEDLARVLIEAFHADWTEQSIITRDKLARDMGPEAVGRRHAETYESVLADYRL